MHDDLKEPLEPHAQRWRMLAWFMIAASTLLHVAYLARSDCHLDLAPDEAHYWDWSQQLDWSYYSKGPLVALLIRGTTAVLGDWSQQTFGNQMLAVRLPAVLTGSLCLIAIYLLTLRVYGSQRMGCAALGVALSLPMNVAQSTLMTIDAPYTCLWGWALLAGHQAYFRGSRWAWPAAGVLVGLGILAKYTMVLWIPSFALFLFTERARRHLVFRPGLWVLTGVAFLFSLPILIWNAQNDWVTFRHVGGQAGVTQSHGIHWLGPLSFVAQQCAMFLGFWFVAWAWAMIDRRPWKDRDPQRQFLWWMSAPMFLNFMLFSFKNGGGQVNWPVTAYSSGLVLTLGWLAEQLNGSLVWRRRLALGSLVASTTAGIVLVVLMHFAVEAQPVLKQIAHPAFPGARFPLRKIDPTCRLRGWRYLASRVDEVRSQLAGQGEDVVLMSSSWRLPGELRFYCSGQPTVYSIGRALGERWSQYDFWRPNPLHDDERFQGKTVILVGLPPCAVISEGFEELVSTQQVTYCEEGEPIADWHITVYRGYRGFPKIHGNTY